jgi:hypothetical protein
MPDSSDMAERTPQRILIADKSGRLNEEAMRARISQEPELKKETQTSIPAQVDLSPATIDALAATLKQATGDPARGIAEAAVAAAGLLDEAAEAKNSLTKSVEKRVENLEPESRAAKSSPGKENESRMTWKEAEAILETYAEKKATGKKITSKEEEAADKALEERDRMVALAKKSGVLDKDMKFEAAAKMDYIVTDYPTNIASGRNLNPREMITAAVESGLRSKGEPQGELEGIRRSWYDGIYRNVDQRILEEQIAYRTSLGMPESPGLKRELSELRQRIGILNWGGLTQPTKERLSNLATISADWLRKFGPDKDDYVRVAQQAAKEGKDSLGLFHPHRQES